MDFRLPALGEGIESATVTQVLVKPGDAVSAGQPVLAVETDKAAMEVEAGAAGKVGQDQVKTGDKAPIGQLVLTLSGAAASTAPGGGRQPPEMRPAQEADAPRSERAAAPATISKAPAPTISGNG